MTATLSLVEPPAFADPGAERSADSELRDARLAMEEQRYDDAIAIARARLASSSTSQPSTDGPSRAAPDGETRAALLALSAAANLIVGREAEATSLLVTLYDLAPAYELDDRSLPPRVTRIFDAEAARPRARRVALATRPLSSEIADYELRVMGSFERLEVSCSALCSRGGRGPEDRAPRCTADASEADGPASWMRVETVAQGAGLFRFRLPTLGQYRCFAVALDRESLPLGRLGSRSSPVLLKTLDRPKPTPPITARWWFWTGAGVALAGAAAAAYFATASSPASPPEAALTLNPRALR